MTHLDTIKTQINHCLTETDLSSHKYRGKVRDSYPLEHGERLIITTDRLTAFDRDLFPLPFKGQILNQLSAWWFEQTQTIVPNHYIDTPHPNAMRVKQCRVFPVEFVMRGYLTGSTNTSLWTLYESGQRNCYGHKLSNGLQKNQRLAEPLLTPTSKSNEHDVPLSMNDIIAQKLMTPAQIEQVAAYADSLFRFATAQAERNGLILVDTKYEFGLDENDKICLVDELHTPDSSRYWFTQDYQESLAQQREPKHFDKEKIRIWYRNNCDPYQDKLLPNPPDSLIADIASSYITLYETLTARQFNYQQPPLELSRVTFTQ